VRKLLLAVLVVAVLLVVGDRVGASLAEQAVARELAGSGLGGELLVDIRGTPFLTQAVAGRYDQVVVQAEDVPAGELRFSQFEATLRGLQVPLSQALSGDVAEVPVESLRARALVPYDELARRPRAADVTVEPVGERVRVTGRVEVLGRTLSATTLSRVELDGDDVVVTAESFDVGNETISAVLTKALTGKLDVRLPIQDLPYGLDPTAVDVTPVGVLVDAFATDTVLTAG
jgi:hypothetical protein